MSYPSKRVYSNDLPDSTPEKFHIQPSQTKTGRSKGYIKCLGCDWRVDGLSKDDLKTTYTWNIVARHANQTEHREYETGMTAKLTVGFHEDRTASEKLASLTRLAKAYGHGPEDYPEYKVLREMADNELS